jgi:hypothetical protein
MIYEVVQAGVTRDGHIEFNVVEQNSREEIMRVWVNPILPEEPAQDGFAAIPERLASPAQLRDLACKKALKALVKERAHLERFYKKVPVGTIEA